MTFQLPERLAKRRGGGELVRSPKRGERKPLLTAGLRLAARTVLLRRPSRS